MNGDGAPIQLLREPLAGPALRALAADARIRRVFLQGAAVEIAASDEARRIVRPSVAEWQVCIGAWRRRHPGEPPAPFVASSLAQWVDAVCDGGSEAAGPDLLFELERPPLDDRDRLETLEPILAAVALEREVVVLVRDGGREHLEGPGAERWDQLTDFGLADLEVLDEPGGRTLLRGRPIDRRRYEQRRAEARKIVRL